MNVKQFNQYMKKHGFIYEGDGKFNKAIENAVALVDETKQLVGALTYTKEYIDAVDETVLSSKMQYYVTRNQIVVSIINSVGMKKKILRGVMKNLSIGADDRLEGFEPYNYLKGVK
jgi:hypothetical protein